MYVVDIETDSLNATRIHVLCWENVLTGETGECIGRDNVEKFFAETVGSLYVGHNILKFDAPVLARLYDIDIGVHNCIDTLVLSTLYSPSLAGGHSLEAWGTRLQKPKIEFNDFDVLTDEMVLYCHQDVAITVELFKRLVKTLNRISFSEKSVWIQHHLTILIEKQRKNGFKFDGPRAMELYQTIRSREAELQDEIRDAFPAKRVLVAERTMRTKDGRDTAIYLRDKERYILELSTEQGRYKAYEDVEFNLGSPKQRVEKLLELGWKPQEFTDAGNPKPFDKGKLAPSLEAFLEKNDTPEVHLIAKWMSLNGRGNMVNTWLENWNEDDGCIHGKLFVADTLRFRHQAPNTANIPAVRVDKSGQVSYGEVGYFTYEARDLWVARPGRVLVGTDAAGLELRMLAHYLNRPDFTDGVVNGDPHQVNADIVGITRPQAKTLIYAVCYGAGDVKIARTLGLPVKVGKGGREYSPEGGDIKRMFLEKLGIGDLIEECQYEQSQGRVSLCDGSRVVCPSPHAALNYKLQGSGARVMGLGFILLERDIARLRLDSLKVGDIHDEWQYDVDPACSEAHARASVQAIRRSGERLGLNVPLDGEAKQGLTWAETH